MERRAANTGTPPQSGQGKPDMNDTARTETVDNVKARRQNSKLILFKRLPLFEQLARRRQLPVLLPFLAAGPLIAFAICTGGENNLSPHTVMIGAPRSSVSRTGRRAVGWLGLESSPQLSAEHDTTERKRKRLLSFRTGVRVGICATSSRNRSSFARQERFVCLFLCFAFVMTGTAN